MPQPTFTKVHNISSYTLTLMDYVSIFITICMVYFLCRTPLQPRYRPGSRRFSSLPLFRCANKVTICVFRSGQLIPEYLESMSGLCLVLQLVTNPMLATPFIGMPVIACLIKYFSECIQELCPLYGATQIPWTCPPIISGFLLAGWKSALLQLVILCVSFFVYLPFIKKIDKMNLVQEKNQPVEDEDEDW